MKNLFKKMMLVAVAAMAFTACSQDVNEVNKVEKVTRYEFTANIADDTRSGFAEKEEGAKAYKSEWHEGDQVKIFIDGYEPIVADITTEGKFSFELTDAPESFYMTVVSPAESWSSKDYSTIPAEQTPLANSVDPVAHILKAQNVQVTNGSADAANMGHEVAYGKMTVNGVDFAIDHVVVNLKGTYYQNYERECTYTINADNVQNNVFWFATETFENVTEFTVTAYGAEGKVVTKTVDVAAADKTLSFNYSRVSTFSVSGLEAVVAPEEPSALVFTSASWTNDWAPDDKFIQFYTEDGGTLQLNFYQCNYSNLLDARTYGFANSGAIYPGGQYSWYKNTAAGIDTEIVSGSVMVSVVNGQYYIEFSNMADYDGVVIEAATFTGMISKLQVPDMRTALAKPNVTATADGKMITISWGAVTGADEYYVFCSSSAISPITTTETTVVVEAPAFATEYEFLIRAVANDSNPHYKTSDDYYFYVTTGKDPDAFADVVLSAPIADSYNSYGFCYRMNFTDDSGKYFRFFFNEADRSGNNSLNVGVYTGIGNGSSDNYVPGAGRFAATMFDNWGRVSGYYARAFKESSTIEVTYTDNEYTIILTHEGKTYGYKGMPDGWVAPAAGGEEPEPELPDQPEPDPSDEIWNVATEGTINARYTYFKFTKGSDTITGMFVYPSMAQIPGLYEVETLTSYSNYKISEVKLNGIFSDSEEGTVNIEMTPDGYYKFTLNLTLNGTKYAGTAMM